MQQRPAAELATGMHTPHMIASAPAMKMIDGVQIKFISRRMHADQYPHQLIAILVDQACKGEEQIPSDGAESCSSSASQLHLSNFIDASALMMA